MLYFIFLTPQKYYELLEEYMVYIFKQKDPTKNVNNDYLGVVSFFVIF